MSREAGRRERPTARGFIAEALPESLELEQDYTVSPEWLEEIRRRCAEIDSGKATLPDGATVINELRGKYTCCTCAGMERPERRPTRPPPSTGTREQSGTPINFTIE